MTPQMLLEGAWVTAPSTRSAQRFRARIYFRGWDGRPRDTSAVRPKQRDAITAAEQQLKDRLKVQNLGDRVIQRSTTVAEAGRIWLKQARRTDSGLAVKTVSDYSESFKRHIEEDDSPVGALSLEQFNDPQRIRLFLQGVADDRGTGSAKMIRSVLSRVIGYAVDNGVLDSNAMRQVGRIERQTPKPSTGRDHARALSDSERLKVMAVADAKAAELNLNPRTKRKWERTADLIAFMAGTGVRIGEARATRWEHIDLASGRFEVPGTKSEKAVRTLNLPGWLVARLTLRADGDGAVGLVFSSPAHLDAPNRAWDQSNSAGAVRQILDDAGLPWAIGHTFRRTVATRLHHSGFAAVRISDQLGHKDPSFTLRTYIGRDPDGDKSDLAGSL